MQPTSSQQAIAQLQEQQKLAQNPSDILSSQRQQLGVQGAQDTVTGLRGAINNTTKLLKQVAPSVMGRTAQSLVTNAQANRIIQNESQPLQASLGEQGLQYNQANDDLARLESLAAQQASGMYQGQQDKLSYLQGLYNILYGREQDAEKARQAELDRQEQIRQFNAQLARSGSGNRSFNLGVNSKTSAGAKQFIGNDDYRGRLAFEAAQGDNDAKVALKYVGNDGRYDGPVGNLEEFSVLKNLGISGDYYVPGLSFSRENAGLSGLRFG